MKALIFGFVMTLASQSFAADLLMTYEYGPGFSRKQPYSVSVNDDGSVVKETVLNGGKVEKEKLATLSKSVVKKIQQSIDEVDLGEALVDENKDKPRCTDAPSTSISIYVSDDLVQIQKTMSCHLSKMQSDAADYLIDIMSALVTLGK